MGSSLLTRSCSAQWIYETSSPLPNKYRLKPFDADTPWMKKQPRMFFYRNISSNTDLALYSCTWMRKNSANEKSQGDFSWWAMWLLTWWARQELGLSRCIDSIARSVRWRADSSLVDGNLTLKGLKRYRSGRPALQRGVHRKRQPGAGAILAAAHSEMNCYHLLTGHLSCLRIFPD